jgi:hypothetical protein
MCDTYIQEIIHKIFTPEIQGIALHTNILLRKVRVRSGRLAASNILLKNVCD